MWSQPLVMLMIAIHHVHKRQQPWLVMDLLPNLFGIEREE